MRISDWSSDVCSSDLAGHGKKYLDVVLVQPFTHPSLGAEYQHVDQSRNHRRHREGQVDKSNQQVLAAKVELGDAPGSGYAKYQIERDGNGSGQQGKPDRRQRVRFDDGGNVGIQALAEGFGKDGDRQSVGEGTSVEVRVDLGGRQ